MTSSQIVMTPFDELPSMAAQAMPALAQGLRVYELWWERNAETTNITWWWRKSYNSEWCSCTTESDWETAGPILTAMTRMI